MHLHFEWPRQEAKPGSLCTGITSPGPTAAERRGQVMESALTARLRQFHGDGTIPAVAFAIGQPEDIGIDEMLRRPTR